jgi:hypothetical protein
LLQRIAIGAKPIRVGSRWESTSPFARIVMAQSARTLDKTAVLTALFRDARQAEAAYRAALDLGYDAADINVLMSEETRDRYVSDTHGTTALGAKAQEPAPEASKRADILGGPVGGTVGTVAPAIAAIGAALLVPGLGLAVAGPIAIALTAAGTAGIATGLIGAFTNWGIPSDRAEHYERGIRGGGIVLGVEPKSAQARAALIQQWKTSGGELIAD